MVKREMVSQKWTHLVDGESDVMDIKFSAKFAEHVTWHAKTVDWTILQLYGVF